MHVFLREVYNPYGAEGAEVRIAGLSGNAAVAAVDEGERTQRSLERLDMEVSRKKGLDFGIFGVSLAEARRTSEQEESTRMVITMSIEVLGKSRNPHPFPTLERVGRPR